MQKINGSLSRINLFTESKDKLLNLYTTTTCRELMLDYVKSMQKVLKAGEGITIVLKGSSPNPKHLTSFLYKFNESFDTSFDVYLVDLSHPSGVCTQVAAIQIKEDVAKNFKKMEQLSLLALLLEHPNIIEIMYADRSSWYKEVKSAILSIGNEEKYIWTAFWVYQKMQDYLPSVSEISGPGDAIYRLYEPEWAIRFINSLEDKHKKTVTDMFKNYAGNSLKAKAVINNL